MACLRCGDWPSPVPHARVLLPQLVSQFDVHMSRSSARHFTHLSSDAILQQDGFREVFALRR